jgi:hypothetical protein
MNWLTAKVLQYVAGGMLLVCLALGARGCALQKDAAVARAEQGRAESARDAAITERDAWKAKAADALVANAAYGAVIEAMQAAEADRVKQQQAAAERAAQRVAEANAAAERARRERDAYAGRFAGKPAGCAAALTAMQAACPMLEGY